MGGTVKADIAAGGDSGEPDDGDTVEPGDGRGDGDRTAVPAARQERLAGRFALLAGAAAVLPALVAAGRAVAQGWRPNGDPSYSAVRAWDVFSTDPPLLGTWSSASNYTGRMVNHPGPLQFDLLAVPVRLLGHGPGTAVGMALVTALSIAALGWLVARRLGPAAATVAMACCALLSWSLGSEVLIDAWQHEPLFPFALYVVAVWCVSAGDDVALPVLVVAGSLVLQTHLSYALLVPGLLVVAAVGYGFDLARERERRQRRVPWMVAAGVVAAACWAQPVIEQFTGSGEGNLAALARSATVEAPYAYPTPAQGMVALGGTVAIPPAWLPPSYGHPSFRLDGSGRPTWLAAAGLVALVAALVWAGWRARRRGSRAVATGAWTALATLGLAAVTMLRTPLQFGMATPYVRWMWPVGMIAWLVLAVAALDELRARAQASPPAAGRPAHHRVIPALVVAVVAGTAALPAVDNGSGTYPWAQEVLDDIDDDVVAAVEGRGPVLVELSLAVPVYRGAPGLFMVLQDAGVPFYVSYDGLVRQLGPARRYEPGRAAVRLRVWGGPDAEARPGERLVAESSPLSAGEARERDRLTGQVEDLVAEHGLVLAEGADDTLALMPLEEGMLPVDEAAGSPDDAVASGTVLGLWSGPRAEVAGGPLLDPEVYPASVLDRWAELETRDREHTIKVFLSDIEPPAA
jgi:hypothetical protein